MFSSNDDSEFLELRDSVVELFQKEESERPWLAEALLGRLATRHRLSCGTLRGNATDDGGEQE